MTKKIIHLHHLETLELVPPNLTPVQKMAKQHAQILQYGEIDGTENGLRLNETTGDYVWYLTRGDDEALVQELRDLNGEAPDDDDGEYYWELKGVSHTPMVTTVEFRSGRGHLSIATILWED